MKVKVDKEKCIGCGSCEAMCPEVFKIVDGKARVLEAKTDKRCVPQAEEACPVDAISVS